MADEIKLVQNKQPIRRDLYEKGCVAKCAFLNWDLAYFLAPQAQKLLPGEKLAKIFDF